MADDKQAQTIPCPHCAGPALINADNAYRPFCSRRCKLIDLGDWLDESNRIADPEGSAAGVPWQGDTTQDSTSH